MIRTTEDVFVHLKRLPVAIREAERKYDPLTQKVMLGQSIDLGGSMFIHGGSGWLMSRACAEFYVSRISEITDLFLNTRHGDDTMPDIFKQMLNQTTEQMDHPGFLGSPLDVIGQERLRAWNFSDLPICPSLELQLEKKRRTAPLKDLVIWHAGTKDLIVIEQGYRVLDATPPWVRLGHVPFGVTLCRADVQAIPGRDGRFSSKLRIG
jgi:hypothetical protein